MILSSIARRGSPLGHERLAALPGIVMDEHVYRPIRLTRASEQELLRDLLRVGVHAGLLQARAFGRDDDLNPTPAECLTGKHPTGDLGRIRARIESPARADAVRWRDEVTTQGGLDEG